MLQSCQVLCLHWCDPDSTEAHDRISDELANAHDMVLMKDLCFYAGFLPATGEWTLPDLTQSGADTWYLIQHEVCQDKVTFS